MLPDLNVIFDQEKIDILSVYIVLELNKKKNNKTLIQLSSIECLLSEWEIWIKQLVITVIHSSVDFFSRSVNLFIFLNIVYHAIEVKVFNRMNSKQLYIDEIQIAISHSNESHHFWKQIVLVGEIWNDR